MKTYRGSPAAARHYVEADRGRADDYYLAEGTGIAERYSASPVAGVRRLESLTGDGYEAWVAGVDPKTGQSKGRLRHDDRAVRFVEVTVNGPKSWSLAAELHPDISDAYDAAQERAATQIVGWLAQHATTRVGPRGAQVQVPVTEIEAVTVRHYTSRAGDPHRHLHLQINARVFAEGQWRGLHTVGVRDSLDAINGIGHAAVMTDPTFRAALAAHGFTLDRDTGEVTQLAEFVGPFSARAAQIARHIDRYEADWRAAVPGQEPGPMLRRSWDARAWADARPDKIVPRDGAELTQRWVAELHTLGYQDRLATARVDALRVGELDRDRAVCEVLARLAARRSGWNAADIRGEVEQLIARRTVVTEAAVRGELAEDLTARTLSECVPLLDRDGVPEHIRALTSRRVLDVEADLTGRLASRAHTPAAAPQPAGMDAVAGLDTAQQSVVAALNSYHQLVVVEGAAGAGKTTTLTATRAALERSGRRLVVVTPTLKAARVAAQQVGSTPFTAAWLAYQHGYRWDDAGIWTRLAPGQTDPVTGVVFAGPGPHATLGGSDLLLVDEAGMLDQDTARALVTIADEHHARIALVGDRHQLPAVGRGGVLDLAARWAAPDACLTLDTVHRFTRTITCADGTATTVADEEYAQLSLTMRTAVEPERVFDALVARGQIRIHASEQERRHALAETAADAAASREFTALLADTREQVADLNAAVRDRRVATGHVDDADATTTRSGPRIGAGDRVATRRNDTGLQVANRDTWTVLRAAADGTVTVSGAHGQRALPADYTRDHLELGYATTVYGVQGETTTHAHLAVGEHTTAASAYVGMTRGRDSNVAHLVADSLDEARDQWAVVFARDRADLGPTHAAELAKHEAARYARLRPLDDVLSELHAAWTAEADCAQRLADVEQRHHQLADIVALTHQRDATVPALRQAHEVARAAAQHASAEAGRLEELVSTRAADLAATLQHQWDQQRDAARHAAQTVRSGPGRLGHRRTAVRHATEQLANWSATWQPYLPTMPTRAEDIAAFARWFDDAPQIHWLFDSYARSVAETAVPDYGSRCAAAEAAVRARDETMREYRDADSYYRDGLAHHGNTAHIDDPAAAFADTERLLIASKNRLGQAQARVNALIGEPALRAQPAERITLERDRWRADRDQRSRERYARSTQLEADAAPQHHQHEPSRSDRPSYAQPDHSPSISR